MSTRNPMHWLRPYLISRVRCQALRAMVEAGGSPSSAQLRAAIEPVLGDLLPLPGPEDLADVDQAEALRRYGQLEAEALRRQLME